MMKMNILVLAGTGIGGTEKAATIFASELSKRGHSVTYLAAEGPRSALLRDNGVNLLPEPSGPSELREHIIKINPDIIHQHVPGYPTTNHLYPALRNIKSRPRVIQTHHFGYINDPESLLLVDYHLFVSKTTASQALSRARIKPSDALMGQINVVMNPIDTIPTIDSDRRNVIRQRLGIEDDAVLGIRVGRPSKIRWKSWEIEAIQHANDLGAKAHLLLVGADEEFIRKYSTRIASDRIHSMPVIQDFTHLHEIYSSCDFCIYASSYGETFGYAIAEAMAAGLPAISRSTPWGGNAQVELIDNGRAGWICATNREMGRRVLDFQVNRDKMRAMGKAAYKHINSLAGTSHETDILEEIMRSLCDSAMKPSLATERRDLLLKFHKQLRDLEFKFSESSLPATEQMEWYLYRTYRRLRSLAGTLNRKLTNQTPY